MNNPKRETFKETVLKYMRKTREATLPTIVKNCIETNKPKSARPEWVYKDVIRKLAKEGILKRDGEKVMIS